MKRVCNVSKAVYTERNNAIFLKKREYVSWSIIQKNGLKPLDSFQSTFNHFVFSKYVCCLTVIGWYFSLEMIFRWNYNSLLGMWKQFLAIRFLLRSFYFPFCVQHSTLHAILQGPPSRTVFFNLIFWVLIKKLQYFI